MMTGGKLPKGSLPGIVTRLIAAISALGTAGQKLRVNAGATGLEFESGWETIEIAAFSAVSEYTKTGLSAFRSLRISYETLVSVDASSMTLRTSSNNGVIYDSGASDYANQRIYGTSATVVAETQNSDNILLHAWEVGNAADEGTHGEIRLNGFNKANELFYLITTFGIRSNGANDLTYGGGRRMSNSARDAIRIAPSSGTMTGRIILEGVRG
jgi:hypothetical protein